MKLKLLVAAIGLITAGSALAAGFQPPAAPAVVDRMELTRNHNGRYGDPNDWMRRITLSGEINVDGSYSSRTTASLTSLLPVDSDSRGSRSFTQFGRKHSSDIALADANLYLNARVNDWVMANLDIVAEDSRTSVGLTTVIDEEGNVLQGPTEKTYRRGDHIKNFDTKVDEAYVTIGNFHESPFYMLVGKEYVPYGLYNRHPVVVPFTQLLTQTNATVAQVGFVDTSGFNGSLALFRSSLDKLTLDGINEVETRNPNFATSQQRQRAETMTAQIGYKFEQADMGMIADLSWLSNLTSVDYISEGLKSIQIAGIDNPFYLKARGGVSLDLMGHYQGLDGQFQYTRALKKMPELCYQCDSSDPAIVGRAAKPGAWLLGVGYSFPVSGHNSRFGVNYQKTRQAVDVGIAGMAKQRWQADYMVNMYKNTDVSFVFVSDKDYDSKDGGTGRKSSTSIVRIATKFA